MAGVQQDEPILISHLVNPFRAPEGSEFHRIQPITYESMRRAQAASPQPVELLAAMSEDEQDCLPEGFIPTAPLQRAVNQLPGLEACKPYPLIAELLGRLHATGSGNYLVFTNNDIALQPHFYKQVIGIIEQGHDAFIINRRRIPGHYHSVDQLEQMYAEKGKSHPGFDCFVFHRDLFPKFELGDVCVGIPFIGILLAQNLFAHARNFKLFDAEHLTFHIGEDVFKPRDKRLFRHNRREFWQAVDRLWPVLHSHNFPYSNRPLLARLWKWSWHPSIPIRLALKLEWRQFWGRSAQRLPTRKRN